VSFEGTWQTNKTKCCGRAATEEQFTKSPEAIYKKLNTSRAVLNFFQTGISLLS